MYLLIIGLSTVIAFSSRALAQTCYFPNGGVSGADTACNPNSLVSNCCFNGQACLSNGLCVSDPHNETLARLHRGTCTDKNWKSGNCPRHCLGINNNGAPVFSCNQTNVDSYCCLDNCQCSNQFETFSFQDAQVYTVTIIGEAFTNTHTSTTNAASSTFQSSNTAASITSSSTAPPASTSGASEENKSNSTAIGVGVGIGVGVLALIIIGVAVFFFWRRKKRNENAYTVGASRLPAEVENNEYYPPQEKGYAYYASSGENGATSNSPMSAASELPTTTTFDAVELPASSPPKKNLVY